MTSPLATAIDRFYRAYEEYRPGITQRSEVELPFRPDFRAALRVANLRMARLRLQIAKVDAKIARNQARTLRTRLDATVTNATPCADCHRPIGDNRRWVGGCGDQLCAECEREAFGH